MKKVLGILFLGLLINSAVAYAELGNNPQGAEFSGVK